MHTPYTTRLFPEPETGGPDRPEYRTRTDAWTCVAPACISENFFQILRERMSLPLSSRGPRIYKNCVACMPYIGRQACACAYVTLSSWGEGGGHKAARRRRRRHCSLYYKSPCCRCRWRLRRRTRRGRRRELRSGTVIICHGVDPTYTKLFWRKLFHSSGRPLALARVWGLAFFVR